MFAGLFQPVNIQVHRRANKCVLTFKVACKFPSHLAHSISLSCLFHLMCMHSTLQYYKIS